jgi:hypothetical protein
MYVPMLSFDQISSQKRGDHLKDPLALSGQKLPLSRGEKATKQPEEDGRYPLLARGSTRRHSPTADVDLVVHRIRY